ncbi:MAG: hypothetical protein HOU81_14285 [Hamadaea sp.]|uniref:lysylphosphatidylglycerol synthase domain-containing protein n=1 Tax=Hamadaea sp. TaxID=2024425 RepID=UPI0018091E3E|nr:lysylphosphatidylglycerol synthase domain-containing protein [Hamadaea sp.]NUR71984.1 hypothetical protein [Hamadaea sp.]NUT22948.1 hypothetical protein [Hamadaea sp.]
MRRRAVTVVFALATAVAIVLVLRGQDWSVLRTTLDGRPTGFVVTMGVLAVLANAAALLAAMWSWRQTLRAAGHELTTMDATRLYFAGQFAKYLPGKVFSLVVNVRMGRTLGVPAARMASAWALTLVIGVLTGAAVGVLAGPELLGASAGWLILAVLPIAAALIRPSLLSTAATLAARVLRRPAPAVDPDGVRPALVTQLLSWLAAGLQLWLIAVALGAPPAGSLLLCVGSFGLATVAGMFAVFAPEGIGVREVLLLAALTVSLPVPVASVVALSSRLIVIVSELLTALVAYGIAVAVQKQSQDSSKAVPVRS